MLYDARPGALLSPYIQRMWIYESDAPMQVKERRLPDGLVSLIINLRDDRIRLYDRCQPAQVQAYSESVLSGAHSDYMLLDSASLLSVMGIEFTPGGVTPFLALPSHKLHNQVVSLEDLWGSAAARLRERVLAAKTPEARFQAVEQGLLARLTSGDRLHPAISAALMHFHLSAGRAPVAAVIDQLALSHARFIAVFREAVGLSPKQYTRILRFQQALRTLMHNRQPDMTDIALQCGYYDQAHFIHDFQAFAGLTPGAYLRSRGEHYNHVAFFEEG